jgi:guanylate kinase
LLDRSDCHLTVYYIKTSDKERLIRQLTREDNPNVDEILRRFSADKQDFHNLRFDTIELLNETPEQFNEAVVNIVSLAQALLAQGQN